MSDCGRCRDCKHWEPKREGNTGLCRMSAIAAVPFIFLIGDHLLFSMADFGCVQFEKREDSNGD